ncbi:hypothetical protein EV643_102464 [Kribbella sp. VKM Ac-2527]|uniref:Uncharacterized protein n=1 Tax=Kribbella caucasensis TaxID=2512215 RepID=A0A4R6KPK8_9ACTN|nr:hypothetical protein [Kribbella sp. VKM Ac-2527]TDO52625.1 hypothetical protein EV643_102464 [Kribbella sp. VKM Ac-2527]
MHIPDVHITDLQVITQEVPDPHAAQLSVYVFVEMGLGSASLTIDPSADDDQREQLLDWALERLKRLAVHGPDPDEWGGRETPDGMLLQLHAP